MKYAFTIILINIILAVLIGGFFFYPRYQDYKEASLNARNKEKELANYQSFVQKMRSIDQELKQNQELVAKVDSAIPNNSQISSFLKFLGDTAKDTGISLEDVSWAECPVSKKEEQIAKQYNVKLQVSGSYFSFKNFLFVLEHTARLVEVSKMSFDTPLDEDESISYNLELRIYSY